MSSRSLPVFLKEKAQRQKTALRYVGKKYGTFAATTIGRGLILRFAADENRPSHAPRTNQTMPTPMAIATSPAIRNAFSGIDSTSLASFFAKPGKPP
jgi:hypothetical protein